MRVFWGLTAVLMAALPAAAQNASVCSSISADPQRQGCFERLTGPFHTCRTINPREQLACYDRWAQQTFGTQPPMVSVPAPVPAYQPPAAQPAPPPTYQAQQSPAPPISVGTDFGLSHLEQITRVSQENEARFRRDYKGRTFSATMPLKDISPGFGRLHVQFSGSFMIGVSCFVSKSEEAKLADMNKGQKYFVYGVIRDTVLGDLMLEDCKITY